MKVLDELEGEITRVAHAAGPERKRRWWRSVPLMILAPLVAAAVAVAAGTGMLTGDPVTNSPGYKPSPTAGLGVPKPGEARLLPLRVADPAGGPPWGLQLTTTTRGYRCVQLGRVVDGRLGVLGVHGSFRGDGRFHPLSPSVVDRANCAQPDARGFAFIAVNHRGVPDSGDGTACTARPAPRLLRRLRTDPEPPVCPKSSMRIAMFGLLGPQGRAVTYRVAGGGVHRTAASGREGAYLVVLPEPDPRPRNFGYWVPTQTPGSGLASVEYRDGSVCRIRDPRRRGGARPCPTKGHTAPDVVELSADRLATRIGVRVAANASRPPGAKGVRVIRQRKVRITFRARAAADARRFYVVESQLSGGHGCHFATMGPIARDIDRGTVVGRDVWVPARCHGRLNVQVGYAQPTDAGGMPYMWQPKDVTPVGSVAVDLP